MDPTWDAHPATWPVLLTVDEVAVVLRTTKKAVYALVARGRLPRVEGLRPRLLIPRDELLHFLGQKSAPSPWR